ncbi:hypothetical protein A2U01_0094187, partial [Trifolium medium]|nr:hypothetical protein [Trifolium medium]
MHQLNSPDSSPHGHTLDKTFISTNSPSEQFTPNAGLPMSEGNNPSRSLFPSHEG